jgi:hypothetical protein
VGADLLERSSERLDVAVGEVAGEVLFDRVPVVSAGLLHRCTALVREDDEDRTAVVLRADAPNETSFFHPVDDPGETALAVQNPLSELVHTHAFGCFLEVDEGVVPAQWDAGVALEFGVEHVDERECALEVEAPGPQALGGWA